MQFDHLKTQVSGRILLPTDTDYDTFRKVFPGDIDRRPAVIVCAADAKDVSTVVTFAQSVELPLAVRSGGHSNAGHGVVEGGVVLDLRDMNGIQVDADSETAWVQPGASAGQVTDRLAEDGFVLGFGDTGSVGVGGITTSGGIGFLVRKFGMTIDNLVAAEIVTADGRLLSIDQHQYPDLFWAMRGGGGNFGVVVNFKFKLHRLTTGYGGMLILPATADVVAQCTNIATESPEEFSAIFNVMSAPPMPFLPPEVHGKLIVMAVMFYAGEGAEGEKVVAPLRELAKPLADMVKPMAYKELFQPGGGEYRPLAISKTMFMRKVDGSTAQTIVDQLTASDAPMRVVQLRVLGGAMSRVDSDATAFAHRQSLILTNVASFYVGEEDRQLRHDWVDATAKLLDQGDQGAYIGFMADEGEARVMAAYPGITRIKLGAVKKQFDPQNVFSLNQNIKPEYADQLT